MLALPIVRLLLLPAFFLAPVRAHHVTPVAQDPIPVHRPLTPAEDAALPPGDGRDAVAFMCVPCHGVLHAIVSPKTPLGWQDTVDDMISRGADGTNEQAEAVVKYLSAHFEAVDVNTASAADMVRVSGLSQRDAGAIVAYREAGHKFKSFADLQQIPGLDEKRLDEAKRKLVFRPR
jgi:competence ComEA-like helix-hairpin-helix protein